MYIHINKTPTITDISEGILINENVKLIYNISNNMIIGNSEIIKIIL